MGAVAVVEGFDVIEDVGLGLAAGEEVTAVDQFQFEGAPEGFHEGVVVAVAFPAHGGDQAGLGQGGAIVVCGVLDAAIGVTEQVFGCVAVPQRHLQRF